MEDFIYIDNSNINIIYIYIYIYIYLIIYFHIFNTYLIHILKCIDTIT